MGDHRVKIDEFNGVFHFKDWARQAGVMVSDRAEIYYSYGWADIVKDFVNAIANCGAVIHGVKAEFGALEISFDVEKNKDEVKVWRAISIAREKSKITCELCGDDTGKRAVMQRDVKALCPDGCRQVIEETIGKLKLDQKNGTRCTGTWLDDY
jgi:hypothetical protein